MRKLRMLCLSALVITAVSTTSISTAEAAEGTMVVSAGVTGYTATQTAGGHTFTMVGGRVWSCSSATFSGTVSNGDKSITATPSYSGCAAKVGANSLPMTVDFTGCDFLAYDLTPTATAGTWSAKTDLVCPAGQAVHLKVYSSESNHTSGTRLCEYTWAPQTLSGMHVTDGGAGTLSTPATNVAIATTRTFGSAGNCGEANFNTTYNGSTLMTASNGTFGVD